MQYQFIQNKVGPLDLRVVCNGKFMADGADIAGGISSVLKGQRWDASGGQK